LCLAGSRLQFQSYTVTVGNEIIFSDTLRESGRIFYPPHYRQVRVRLPACPSLFCPPARLIREQKGESNPQL